MFMMGSCDVHDGQQLRVVIFLYSPMLSLLKENPLLCHEADAALKKIM
jgi:hypothetical protein